MTTVLRIQELADLLQFETERVVIGMRAEVRACLIALLTGGHVLLEGPPGVAKTLLVRTLASALGGDFGRVQFTPDLMPSDVTGTSVFRPGEGSFQFRPGPIFAQLLLCDEINRAPAKTQAALLEAMQEGSVTVDGTSHTLPKPFTVFATMNPLEHEGTYPLPEAQLDRFLMKIQVGYPEIEEYEAIVDRTTAGQEPEINNVSSSKEIMELRKVVLSVPVPQLAKRYAIHLVVGAQPGSDFAPKIVNEFVSLGPSPRAVQSLMLASKVRALTQGRFAVSTDDIKAVAYDVMRHRIIVNFHGAADGVTADRVIQDVLAHVQPPVV
jgi:MoxR-like ATPase